MVKLPDDRAAAITQYLADTLSAEARTRAGARARQRAGDLQGMDRADARPALARSAADRRRHDLVERPVHQPRRPPQSEDRRDEGIPSRNRRPSRTASSTTRTATSGTRATATARSASSSPRPGRSPIYKMPDPAARDPHTAIFGKDGNDVLHAAAEQHARPPRSVDRRDQAGHADDAARAAVRHQAGFAGHDLGVVQRLGQARAAWIR